MTEEDIRLQILTATYVFTHTQLYPNTNMSVYYM